MEQTALNLGREWLQVTDAAAWDRKKNFTCGKKGRAFSLAKK